MTWEDVVGWVAAVLFVAVLLALPWAFGWLALATGAMS